MKKFISILIPLLLITSFLLGAPNKGFIGDNFLIPGYVQIKGGDANDYLKISVTGDVPYIQTVGDCNLNIDVVNASATSTLSVYNSGAAQVANLDVEGIVIAAGLTLTGDITTTGAAIDWDMIDNNASALSFDVVGAAGLLNFITTNNGEGISFSSPATGTTDMYTFTATGNFADGSVVKITDSGTPTDGTLLKVLSVNANPDAIVAGGATNFITIASDGSIDFATETAAIITSTAGDIKFVPAGDEVHFDSGISIGDDTEVGDNNFKVVGTSLLEGTTTLTTAGVTLAGADGVLTIAGIGDGNDENLTFDFDNGNANMVDVSTGTGVTALNMSGMYVLHQGLVDQSSNSMPAPYYKFDGVNDKVTVTDHADLDFGTGDGAIEAWVYMPDVSARTVWLSRYTDADNQLNFGYNQPNGVLELYFKVATVELYQAVSNWSPSANTWYHILWTFDNGTSNELYIDGVPQTIVTDVHTSGDMSLAADLEFGKYSTNYYKQQLAKARQWNVHLTAAEVKAFQNGSIPFKYQGASQTEFFITAEDRTFTAGTSSWANVDLGTTFDETTDLSLVASATGQYCKITFTDIGTALELGKRYRLVYDYAQTTAGYEFKLVGTATQTLGDAVVGTGQIIEFTAEEDYTAAEYLGIFAKTNATAAGDFDNFSLIQIGCVAEYAPDGIASGYWYDKSGNALDGTISGATAHNVSVSAYYYNAEADATGVPVEFYKESASPADDDVIKATSYNANDSGGNKTEMIRETTYSRDVTDGDEAGGYEVSVRMNDVLRSMINIDGFGQGVVDDATLVFNEDGQDIDTRIEGVGQVNAIIVQGSDGKVGINTNTFTEVLNIDGNLNFIGAQTIQTSTGQLDIATAAGDGDILLTPHGSGDVVVTSAGLVLSATEKIYLDGEGDTYLHEVSADVLDVVVGGNTKAMSFIEASNMVDIRIQKQVVDFAIVNTTSLGGIQIYGDDDTGAADEIAGQIEVIATGTWTDGAEDAKMVLNVANNGTLNANQLVLNTDGTVSMGGGLTLTGDITISNADPVLNYIDETGADNDINATIAVDLVTATSGAEDATVTIQNQVDGTMRDMLVNVVEGNLTLTSYKGDIILTAGGADITTNATVFDFDAPATISTSGNNLLTLDGGTSGIMMKDLAEVTGDNSNAAYTLLTLLNTAEPATGETGQTSDLVFEVRGTINNGGDYTNEESAKISMYKIADYFHASDQTDNDAGLKLYTVTNGAYVLNSTFSDNDLAVVGTISSALYGSDGSVSDAELLYLDATSSIQTQLDARCLESVFGTAIGTGLLLDATTLKTHVALQSISGLTETNGGIPYGTADNAYAWLSAGAEGTLLMGNGAGAPSFLGAGTAGYFLIANGAADPVWTTQPTIVSIEGLTLTAGDMVIATGADAVNVLDAGANTTILVGGGAANPVWTTATGSGAPVRATSPALVTPTLGVATATSLKTSSNNGTANTGVTAVEYGDGYQHTTVLTVSQSAALTVGDNVSLADGYLLYTFPAGVVVVDYAYMSISVDGVTEQATDQPDVGLGTVIATGAIALLDGTGTFENIITGQTAANCNGTATVKTALPTANVPFIIESGDAHTLHFNVADLWAAGATDLTGDIAGTVVLVWSFLQ